MAMRAMQAETFSDYDGLLQIDLPKPQPAQERALVRVTAAGVIRSITRSCRVDTLEPRRRSSSAMRA
jgi:hypothetical protein